MIPFLQRPHPGVLHSAGSLWRSLDLGIPLFPRSAVCVCVGGGGYVHSPLRIGTNSQGIELAWPNLGNLSIHGPLSWDCGRVYSKLSQIACLLCPSPKVRCLTKHLLITITL